MLDWLQFSILDMTPYSRQGWLELIESFQQDYTYIPLVSLLCAALLAFMILRPPFPEAARLVLAFLAFAWFWCGWVFQMQYHASLNWAAPQFGWVFIAQTALLTLAAIFAKSLLWGSLEIRYQWPSFLILLLALLYPLIGLIEGRTTPQIEWLGLMPTPTTLATLGILMLLGGRTLWLLMPIPVLWALVSAAFTWKLDLFEPYVTAMALLLCLNAYFLRVRHTKKA